MICSDIWHKYHEWYFKIVIRNLRQFWNITSGIYAKCHVQIMLLFVYTTTHKRFVIFTCRYFKLSWNTTALSQSNGRNFSCSSIMGRSTRIITAHYACRNADLTLVTGTTNGFSFQTLNSSIESWGIYCYPKRCTLFCLTTVCSLWSATKNY